MRYRWMFFAGLAAACAGAADDKDDTVPDPDGPDRGETDSPGVDTDAPDTDAADTDVADSDATDTDAADTELPDPANQPPGAPVVSIEPADPTTLAVLVATIVTDAVDPEGDALTYTTTWVKDGVAQAQLTDTVVAAQTTRDEVWQVQIAASDGNTAGPVGVASVTILNSAPRVSGSWLTPAPAVADDLVVQTVALDADGDPVTLSFQWQLDGVPTSHAGDTVPGADTSRGDTWEVTVTPHDGTDAGDPLELGVVVGNHPPEVVGLTLSPNPAYAYDLLMAAASVSDPDGDPTTVDYAWEVNGANVQRSSDPTLAPGFFSRGDTVIVSARADDGFTVSATVSSAPLVIANSPPIGPMVTLQADPLSCADLVCEVVSDPVDPDGDAVSVAITWTLEGVAYTGPAGNGSWPGDTIPSSALVAGQTWSCEAIASDGVEASAPASDATVVAGTARQEVFVQQAVDQLDLLLVIDNSCSMAEEQDLLSSSFMSLGQPLIAAGVDFHLGVITTDMDDPAQSGALRTFGGQRFIEPTTPNAALIFEGLVTQGTGGSANEAGLDAVLAALTPPLSSSTGANSGFARQDAALGVVVFSDEDDASAMRPAELAVFLEDEGSSGPAVSFSSFVGPLPNGCATATPGRRYLQVTDRVGGSTADICDGDWSDELAALAEQVLQGRTVFPLDDVPAPGSLVVEVVVPGGPTFLLTEGGGYTFDLGLNRIELALAPEAGSEIIVSYEASCDAYGDTAYVDDTFNPTETGIDVIWPVPDTAVDTDTDTALAPLPSPPSPFPFPFP